MGWYVADTGVKTKFTGGIVTVGAGKDYTSPQQAMTFTTGDNIYLIYPGTYPAITVLAASRKYYLKGMSQNISDVIISDNITYNAGANGAKVVIEGITLTRTGMNGMGIWGNAASSLIFNRCNINFSNSYSFAGFANIVTTAAMTVKFLYCTLGVHALDTFIQGYAWDQLFPLTNTHISKSILGNINTWRTSGTWAVMDRVTVPTVGYGSAYGSDLITQGGVIPHAMHYRRLRA